jgi:hypothetical protein
MDKPAIYSETLCEKMMACVRSAFGVWRGRGRGGRVWAKRQRKQLKTGADKLQNQQSRRRAEFFALPICCQRKAQPLLALLVTDY